MAGTSRSNGNGGVMKIEISAILVVLGATTLMVNSDSEIGPTGIKLYNVCNIYNSDIPCNNAM